MPIQFDVIICINISVCLTYSPLFFKCYSLDFIVTTIICSPRHSFIPLCVSFSSFFFIVMDVSLIVLLQVYSSDPQRLCPSFPHPEMFFFVCPLMAL